MQFSDIWRDIKTLLITPARNGWCKAIKIYIILLPFYCWRSMRAIVAGSICRIIIFLTFLGIQRGCP